MLETIRKDYPGIPTKASCNLLTSEYLSTVEAAGLYLYCVQPGPERFCYPGGRSTAEVSGAPLSDYSRQLARRQIAGGTGPMSNPGLTGNSAISKPAPEPAGKRTHPASLPPADADLEVTGYKMEGHCAP